MNEFQKHYAEWKIPKHKRVATMWFHLREAQEHPKLTYSDRNQKVAASGWRVGIDYKWIWSNFLA